MRRIWVVTCAALAASCTRSPPPIDRGTYDDGPPPAWVSPPFASTSKAITAQVGQVAILEGDETTVSRIAESQWGLRFDEERNDLAAVATRLAREIGDPEAQLVLFTLFDDVGGGGPAYFVPFFHDTPGVGREPVDQRAIFGVERLTGIANLKRRTGHLEAARIPLLVHELTHAHAAYLSARTEGATTTVDLLGRQRAHWQASLHSGGSVLGGHGFVEQTPGEFVVVQREDALGPLDLYALGLLPADDVPDFFVIEDPRTEDGFAIPREAQLFVGTRVLGQRRTITIEDVVREHGPRAAMTGTADIVFALLTTPGIAATSTTAREEALALDDLRQRLEADWPRWTAERGRLCTRWQGCSTPDRDAGLVDGGHRDAGPLDGGAADAGTVPPRKECRCTTAGRPAGPGPSMLLLGFVLAAGSKRNRRGPRKSPSRAHA